MAFGQGRRRRAPGASCPDPCPRPEEESPALGVTVEEPRKGRKPQLAYPSMPPFLVERLHLYSSIRPAR